MSRKIAEDRFLPAVRGLKPGERLVAHGFSCRSQAFDLAGAAALHPLEAVAERLRPPGHPWG